MRSSRHIINIINLIFVYCLPLLLIFYTMFMPEAYLTARFQGQMAPSAGFLLPWAALNLALWAFFVVEAWRLLRRASRHAIPSPPKA